MLACVLLRAEADDFSAGADVSLFTGSTRPRPRQLETTVLSLIAAIEASSPTLALIHGNATRAHESACGPI